jgi:hypothetical protein
MGRVVAFCSEKSCRPAFASVTAAPSRVRSTEGRPALVDAYAKEPVEALIIPPDQLRALLIAEAELGERITQSRLGILPELRAFDIAT